MEGSKPGKKDKDKKFPVAAIIKKRDEVEFSDVKSLAENIKTTSGVKYTYEGKTYEEKKRNITTLELKKTLHQRRISRDEFKKIKDLNGNIEDYDEKLKKSTVKENKTLKTQRSQSEAKLPESRATTKNKEKIHINNGNLREKLLEKVNQPEYIQQSDEKEIES